MSNLKDWKSPVDLLPYEKIIKAAAKRRESQKKGYKTSRQWSKDPTNLVGLKGEFAFHMFTGLSVGLSLNATGDFGADFLYEKIAYDIKTTTYTGEDPALLEMPNKKLIPHVYVLMRVNEWVVDVVGWASRKQMKNSKKRDFGHGERLCITQSDMISLGQNTIPPCVPSSSTTEKEAKERAESQLNTTGSVVVLPKQNTTKAHCFPHGPFEKRRAKKSSYPALYCKKCGRFYGIDKSSEQSVIAH